MPEGCRSSGKGVLTVLKLCRECGGRALSQRPIKKANNDQTVSQKVDARI